MADKPPHRIPPGDRPISRAHLQGTHRSQAPTKERDIYKAPPGGRSTSEFPAVDKYTIESSVDTNASDKPLADTYASEVPLELLYLFFSASNSDQFEEQAASVLLSDVVYPSNESAEDNQTSCVQSEDESMSDSPQYVSTSDFQSHDELTSNNQSGDESASNTQSKDESPSDTQSADEPASGTESGDKPMFDMSPDEFASIMRRLARNLPNEPLDDSPSSEEPSERSHDPKAAGGRDQVRTGWTVIAKNDSVVEIIDTLLDMPQHREFNKSELAELAGVSRKSVHNHIDLLLQLGVVMEVSDTSPQRYRFNPESEIAEHLIRLDGAVNNAGPYTVD